MSVPQRPGLRRLKLFGYLHLESSLVISHPTARVEEVCGVWCHIVTSG